MSKMHHMSINFWRGTFGSINSQSIFFGPWTFYVVHRKSIPVRELDIFSLSPFPSIIIFQNSPNREDVTLPVAPSLPGERTIHDAPAQGGLESRLVAAPSSHAATPSPSEASHVVSQATASRASRWPRRAAQGQSQRPRNNSQHRQPILHSLSEQHERAI